VVPVVAGHNLASGETKVKVLLDDAPDVVPLLLRAPTVAVLEALRGAALACSVVDRRHKHTSDLSESYFWLAPLPPCAEGPVADRSCPDARARTAQAATVPEPAATAAETAAEPPAETEVLEQEPWWFLQNTRLLLRGCVRDQAEVKRKLLAVPSAELTDLQLWLKTQFGYTTFWDDAEIKNMHRLLCAHEYFLLFLLTDWFGEDFVLSRRYPPQGPEAAPAAQT
jgi:hypothetical protein